MKVGDLKKYVSKLKSDSEEVTSLIANFLGLLDREEELCHHRMMPPIKAILNDFWNWVATNIPREHWHSAKELIPWRILEQELINEELLESQFHEKILYHQLKSDYEQYSGNNPLGLAQLMPLLITCGRMLGYPQKNEETYPVARLKEKIAAKRPQESHKINEIMMLLRCIFYLIYHYCNAQQLALLPYLIYFRHFTTEEERHAELAIFKWLSQNPDEILKFFKENEQDYVNIKAFKDLRSLQVLNSLDLLPRTRSQLIKMTVAEHWVYSFQKLRPEISEDFETSSDHLIDEILSLLNLDFKREKDESFAAVLQFGREINKLLPIFSEKEAAVVKAAHCIFHLNKYIARRQRDPLPKHSFLSLSGDTKCRAAEKKQLHARGQKVQYSFFETIALHQGKLKEALDVAEAAQGVFL